MQLSNNLPEEIRERLKKLTSGHTSTSSSETPQEREEKEARLYNAEEGHLYEQDGYNCPKCKNRGYIAKVAQIADRPECVLADCECMEIRKSLAYMRSSGLAELSQRCTFDSFLAADPWQRAIKERAMQYAENPDKRWLFLGGQVGSGKSHLGIAATVAIMKKTKKRARYFVWPEEIRKTWGDNEAYGWFVRNAKEVPVLYLDDLFKPTGDGSRPSANEIRTAFDILNYRYNNKDCITIISSEYTGAELIGIDEAVGSRIYERTKDGSAINIARDKSRNFRTGREVLI